MKDILINFSDYIVLIPSVILGGIVAYWIYLKQKVNKLLSYEVISSNNVIQIDTSYKDSIRVFFEEKEIDNLWIKIIKFENRGNVPIEKKDFHDPITIILDSQCKIIAADIIDVFPKNINLELIKSTNRVELEPTLLNSKDRFSLQIMYSGNDSEIEVVSRISGIKNMLEYSKRTENNNTLIFLPNYFFTILTLIFTLGLGTAIIPRLLTPKPTLHLLIETISLNDSESRPNLYLIPNNSAKDKFFIFYNINSCENLILGIKSGNSFEIELKDITKLEDINQFCYTFDTDSKICDCIQFHIVKTKKQ